MATAIDLPTSAQPTRDALRAAITELVDATRKRRARSAPTSAPPTSRMLFSGVAHATALAGELQPVLRQRYVTIILDGLRPADGDRLPGQAARLRRSSTGSRTARAEVIDRACRATHRRESTRPARWATLAIVIVAAFIVVLDNTVLNVAIPTILRDFDTTLPSLQWVITGYALTFATLLIIGGRLGDIYGHRRIFIIGAALFGVGSFIAALSQGVPELILGEAIIEGIGASLMLPATLAILSSTFQGRERATAFAAWGATAGVAVAFGPSSAGSSPPTTRGGGRSAST